MSQYKVRKVFSRYGRLVAGVTIAFALLFASLALYSYAGVQANEGPSVSVEPDVLGQQQVTVAIDGRGMSNLGGFEFDLEVNPPIAEIDSFELGPFLGSGDPPRTTGVLSNENFPNAFGAYSYGDENPPGADGDGTLAKATLNILTEGVATLALTHTIFADTQANQQTVGVEDAMLQAKQLRSDTWELISACADTSGIPVPSTVQSIDGDYTRIRDGLGNSYIVGLPDQFQSLHELGPGWSYSIRVTSGVPVTLTMVGGEYDPRTPLELAGGAWRWIGYCLREALPVAEALDSIDGKYTRVRDGLGNSYIVGLPDQFQSLTELTQGLGYRILMSEDGVLEYPDPSEVQAAAQTETVVATAGACSNQQRTLNIAEIYGEITIDGNAAPAGTVVEAVTPRGEIAGCFEVTQPGYFGVMHVYGEDVDAEMPGFRDAESITWRVSGVSVDSSPAVSWTQDIVESVQLSVGAVQQPSEDGRRIFLPIITR